MGCVRENDDSQPVIQIEVKHLQVVINQLCYFGSYLVNSDSCDKEIGCNFRTS